MFCCKVTSWVQNPHAHLTVSYLPGVSCDCFCVFSCVCPRLFSRYVIYVLLLYSIYVTVMHACFKTPFIAYLIRPLTSWRHHSHYFRGSTHVFELAWFPKYCVPFQQNCIVDFVLRETVFPPPYQNLIIISIHLPQRNLHFQPVHCPHLHAGVTQIYSYT